MSRQRAAPGKRALTAWLAVLAVFIAALAPTVSHALRGGAADGWAEICSAAGVRWINVDPTSKAPQQKAPVGHSLEHCPYCSIHVATLGMPPVSASFVMAIDPTRSAIPVELPLPPEFDSWQRPQARGPPKPTLIG